MRLKGKGGIQYELEAKPFAQGGEGQVFNIIGKPNSVAKLYKDNISLGDRERKLNVMVTYPPDKSVLSQIAWPTDVLYNGNSFVGFVMPKLKINEDLNVIYEYGSTAKYPNIPWSNKIIIAKNLCAVLNAVHDAGHACGDLNPKNISVDPSTGHIVFVDTDSYHIQDGSNIYRCCVGIPEYLPVEIQRKMKGGLSTVALPTFSKYTDDFALAIHIFQLLMNGVHPFSCAVLPSQVSVAFPQPSDNILNGAFPFMQKVQGITIPKFAPPIDILPKDIQDLFRRAFIVGHTDPTKRPTPVEWYSALTNLENNLKTCSQVSHHEYYNGLSDCPWCAANKSFSMGVQTAASSFLTQSTIKQSMKPAYIQAPTYNPNQNSRSSYSNTPTSKNSGAYTGTYRGGYNKIKISKKKLIIWSIICVIIILSIVIPTVYFTNINNLSDTYKTILKSDGTIVITGLKENGKLLSELIIPDKIDGKPVVEIKNYAFNKNQVITLIDIPDSIKKIGKRAFNKCPNLEEVDIGNGTETIDDLAFYECLNLKKVTIGTGIKYIGKNAFQIWSGYVDRIYIIYAEIPPEIKETFYGSTPFPGDGNDDYDGIFVPEEYLQNYRTKWSNSVNAIEY